MFIANRTTQSAQPRRGGMFIARRTTQSGPPRRGGMVTRGGSHVAPAELEGVSGGRLLCTGRSYGAGPGRARVGTGGYIVAHLAKLPPCCPTATPDNVRRTMSANENQLPITAVGSANQQRSKRQLPLLYQARRKGTFMKLSTIAGVLCSALLAPLHAPGQVYNWTVIAGLANTPTYADGTNSAAFFNNPQGIAVDGAGNVYVADRDNYVIRKISPAGSNWVTTTIAGSPGVPDVIPYPYTTPTDGVGSSARFSRLNGIAVGGNGNLYVQDWSTSCFHRKIMPTMGASWAVSTLFSSRDGDTVVPGSGGATDAIGNYYTASNYAIIRLTPVLVNGIPSQTSFVTTTLAGFAGFPGTADGINNAARFYYPSVFGVDSAGTIYLRENYPNSSLRTVSPSGPDWVTTTINQASPTWMALDSAGNIYGSAGGNGYYYLQMLQAGTANWRPFGGFTNSTALAGIAIGADGSVFVADSGASVIWRGVAASLPLGSLQVNLQPSAALSAGAAWRVDAGLWQTNGATVTNLLAGSNHVLAFAPAYGWAAPADQWVTISGGATTTVLGNYVQQFGALQVNLTPSDATNAGAQWQLDGGPWQTSGATLSNLTVGAHTVAFTNVVGFITPATQTNVSIVPNQTTVIAGDYVALGAVQVTLNPAGAVSAGAQWQLDSGDWQASGVILSNLSLGSHTIAFLPVTGWITPSNVVLTVNSGQTNTVTADYVVLGSLRVTLNPAGAVSGGAQWQVDGGAWQNSGNVISNLATGTHTLGYSLVSGYITPTNQTLSINPGGTTNIVAAYVALGGVAVSINPTNAVTGGAQWALDGGAWQNSGAVLTNPALGAHTVSYLPLSSWLTPSNQVVNVVSGQTTNVAATYIALGSLQVTITPTGAVSAGARWQLDGGAWQTSGTVVSNLVAGSHTVAFTNLAGWTTPASQAVTVNLSQTTATMGLYVQQLGNLQVVLSPAGAVSEGAQWRVDNGAWQASGTTLPNVTVGSHTVAYASLAGWVAPTNQMVNISSNQTTRLMAVYQGQGSLQVMLVPSGAVVSRAQWQVDGGPWMSNGMVVSGLSRGTHTVSYQPASGWVAPANQSVSILANQLTVTNGFYTGLGYLFTTIAGTVGSNAFADGTNGTALFDTPVGICVGVNSNLYLADTGNSVIRKLTPTTNGWVSSTIAGLPGYPGNADGTNSQARFDYPSGVAVGTNGNLYVADQVNSTVRKIATDGTNWTVSTIAGSAGNYGSANGTNGAARFYYPSGVAVDLAGNVYVTDQINSTIRKLTPLTSNNWAVTTIAGSAGVSGSADGTNSTARFSWPSDLAVDASGNILVADTFNNTIRKVSPVGTNYVTTTICGLAGVSGSLDGTNNTALFDGPGGIALDVFGNLFVADSYSSVIRKLTPVGTNWVVNTVGGLAYATGATDGTNSTARFDTPCGVCVDGNGVVYVADTYNQTIRAGFTVYQLPANPNVLIAPVGKSAALSWQAQAGLSYQVQFKTNLLQAAWFNLGSPILATNTVLPFVFVDLSATNDQRLYRVKVLP